MRLRSDGELAIAELPVSSIGFRDLLVEAVSALLARPSRSALTALGTVLGVGALVSTLGIAQTAGNQIITRFDELAATEVRAEPQQIGFGSGARAAVALPWDVDDRLQRLNGVVAAGTLSEVDTAGALATSVPVTDPLGTTEFDIPVVAASPGLFGAVRAELSTGRFFDAGHDLNADKVAILGAAAAQRLNVTRVDNRPAIKVGEEAFVVIGILDDVQREPALLSRIIIPNRTAEARYGLAAPSEVYVETQIGAARLIAGQVPTALAPGREDQIAVRAAPDPTQVRNRVEGDVNALFIVLGSVSLLVGAIGIANVTLVSVLERRGEIGLRRAVGAARRHIATQFLVESTLLGALGGLIGTSAGILLIVGVSAARDWTPVLESWLPFVAPATGALVGLLAGLYPALKAANTEPIAALRG